MKHDAAWFFNFFNQFSNWIDGYRYSNGGYCAIGHLQSYEGITDTELQKCPIYTPLVMECAKVIFNGSVAAIWKTNDVYLHLGRTPKERILRACRLAILRENPKCQLGKEYDLEM